MDDFLATRVRTLEAIQLSQPKLLQLIPEKGKNNKGPSVKGHNASTNSKCLMCKESHHLFKCKQFRELSIDQRKELALRHYCCLNCSTPGHKPYDCPSKYTCAKCHRKHNTLLHFEFKANSDVTSTTLALTVPISQAISSQVAGIGNTEIIRDEVSDSPLSLSIKGAHHSNSIGSRKNIATDYHLNNNRDLSRSTLYKPL